MSIDRKRDRGLKYIWNEYYLAIILSIIGTIIMFQCEPAEADEYCDYYALGLWSYHWDRDKEYNEDHQRVGCEGILGSGTNISYFRNSHGDDAALLSRHWTWKRAGSMSLGIEYGVVYGYGDKLPNLYGVAATVLPRVSYFNETTGVGIDCYVAYTEAVTCGFKFVID